MKLRPLLRWLIKSRSSPREIAGGFAIGVFISFTPTIGLQVVLAVLLAGLLKLHQPAAVSGALVTNPFTFPIIFTFNYWLGNLFLSGPSISIVSRRLVDLTSQLAKLKLWNITEQLAAVSQLGSAIFAPLLLGSFLAGIFSAVLSYFIVIRLMEALISRRERLKNLKNKNNQ